MPSTVDATSSDRGLEFGVQTDIINTQEVAKILGLSERTVRKLLENGELPGLRLGRQWRCKRTAIYALFPE